MVNHISKSECDQMCIPLCTLEQPFGTVASYAYHCGGGFSFLKGAGGSVTALEATLT